MKEKYPKRMFFENYEYIPKQPLIKFLENNIKNQNKLVKEPINDDDYRYQIAKCIAFQEVLDFVNKGGKE